MSVKLFEHCSRTGGRAEEAKIESACTGSTELSMSDRPWKSVEEYVAWLEKKLQNWANPNHSLTRNRIHPGPENAVRFLRLSQIT